MRNPWQVDLALREDLLLMRISLLGFQPCNCRPLARMEQTFFSSRVYSTRFTLFRACPEGFMEMEHLRTCAVQLMHELDQINV